MAWKLVPEQSKIEFEVGHFKITTERGRFELFEGTLDMNEEDPLASSIEGTVEVSSLKTGISIRDKNVMGRFKSKSFPRMSFRSTRVADWTDDSFTVHGDMTIKDITRPTVFHITNKGEQPAQGGKRTWAFGAELVVNRKDYDIEWVFFMDWMVGEEIHGELDLLFVQE
jgi:polyisoprenoid-binding protein YceI